MPDSAEQDSTVTAALSGEIFKRKMFENAKKHLLSQLRAAAENGGLPSEVVLTTYRDDDAYRFFRHDEYTPGIAAKHERAMLFVSAEISREFPGVSARLIPLSIDEYEKWRAKRGLEDSPEVRAMHAIEQR